MDKKDIYEHLARIYLDASSQKKKKGKENKRFKIISLAGIALVFALSIWVFNGLHKDKALKSQIQLLVSLGPTKINFNFDPAKKETYSITLNKLNLTKFKSIGFSVKRENYFDRISLRVELTNNFREKSEIYIKDIPHKWQEYKIDFSQFRNINDWSEMTDLSFVVEEWNTKENAGVVYLDNISFLR